MKPRITEQQQNKEQAELPPIDPTVPSGIQQTVSDTKKTVVVPTQKLQKRRSFMGLQFAPKAEEEQLPEPVRKRQPVDVVLDKERNEPTIVDKPFIRPEGFKGKILEYVIGDEYFEKSLKEPLLLLIKENGYIEVIEDVRAGEFVIVMKEGGEKSVMLTPKQILTLKYGKQYFKAWIAYENCATAYPEDPIYSAEQFRKITQKLAMNWKDRDEQAENMLAKGKMWMYIIGGLAIAVVLIFSIPGAKEALFGQVAQNVTAAVNATVNATVTTVSSNASSVGASFI